MSESDTRRAFHRWWLHFDEPALEAAWIDHVNRVWLVLSRNGLLLATVLALMATVGDFLGSVESWRTLAAARVIMSACALTGAVALWRSPWAQRHTRDVVFGTVLIAIVLGIPLLERGTPTSFGPVMGIATSMPLALVYILLPIGYLRSFGLGLATSTSFVASLITRPVDPDHLMVNLFGHFLTHFVLLLGSWLIERNRRSSWLANRLLDKERERSEALLRNVLPDAVAARLKAREGTIADGVPEATVLFSDIVGFTQMSASIPPEELVRRLNDIFTLFDELADRHGLEKIKTIGDAYMVAGGLPEPRPDHAEAVARMALDMREALRRWSTEQEISLDVRIGVHTGPVVAGVIGKRKFAYDLWGDTVNTASRMESHSEPGRVQISAATRERLGDAFTIEERGVIPVKGKGEMRTFWLTAPQASAGTSPTEQP